MIKKYFLTSLQKFIKIESSAGLLLFSATIIALILANSQFAEYYHSIWKLKLGFSFHNFELKKDLILWINDGLMAIFFFFIGLELKRELLVGEINTIKKAAFPFIAAMGGILIPVGLFLFLNDNPETTKAWGVPMATDIAFALAILSILGKRVPLSLKIFLTAFAIFDDLAAVLVIASFYSTDVNWWYILLGILLTLILSFYYYKRKYELTIGLITAVVVWVLFLKSGIHPTIAGVLLAFTIPIRKKINMEGLLEKIQYISNNIVNLSSIKETQILTKEETQCINNLDDLTSEVVSPLQHLEHKLHYVIAYFILPVFAFANSGVTINLNYDFDYSLIINIAISMFLGKFVGIFLFSYLGVKLKLVELPSALNFHHILGIAAIAGVGFTMSIFIANLAFQDDLIRINSAKVGIIIGSFISALTGYLLLKFLSKNK